MKTVNNRHSALLHSIMLAALAILFTQCSIKPSAKADVNPTLETIFSRYSVRSYTKQPVESEKVELMLRAAMAAPTAQNKQPWAFMVIDDRVLLDSLKHQMPYAKMFETANLAILVCGDLNKSLSGTDQDFWIQDCSAATQNLLLAAHSLGLGAVWVGLLPREERMATINKVLKIPSYLIPLNIIPIGYPEGNPAPKDKWKPENVSYNTWE